MFIIHTREGHRPDLSDAPPAKVERGAPSKRIGDPGPMGRILVRGEPGHDIVPELYPRAGEPVVDKPGKGSFHATDLHQHPAEPGHRRPDRLRRHHRGLRAHHRARGQRPRLPLHGPGRLLRLVFPGVPRGGAADDQGPGRDLRLGDRFTQSSGGHANRRDCMSTTAARPMATDGDDEDRRCGRRATGTPSSASAPTSWSTCWC